MMIQCPECGQPWSLDHQCPGRAEDGTGDGRPSMSEVLDALRRMPERPEPRRWTRSFCDPCRGTVRVTAAPASPERFAGDYGGSGWAPLGTTGYDVRCWPGVPETVCVQYRPNDSPRFPEHLVPEGGDVTDPAPDISGPPSLRDAFRAFTPAGTDPDALMKALKAAQMPSVPLSDLGKAAEAGKGMVWCRRCSRPEPVNAGCPNEAFIEAPEPSLPPDPSPGDLMAGIGIADMLKAMTDGGVPLASAERIIGAMLAAHGIMAAERDARDR